MVTRNAIYTTEVLAGLEVLQPYKQEAPILDPIPTACSRLWYTGSAIMAVMLTLTTCIVPLMPPNGH